MARATDPPRLCIVGVGRTGSGYIAAVLSAVGVCCGHEAWWNPDDKRLAGLDADSSWLAVGDPVRSQHVGMQARHPLATIASLTESPDWGGYRLWRETVIGRLPDDPLEAACVTYLRWTELAHEMARGRWWRAETLDPGTVVALAASAGHTVTHAAATEALASVPTTLNYHGTTLALGWDDLPSGLRGPVRRSAEGYGYS